MNQKIVTIALLATTALVSCKKTLPVACLTASKTEATVNEDITFASCATDAASLAWNFGDAATATGESATHKYTKAGTYAVNLRAVSKKDKAADNAVVIITVKDAPIVVAQAPKERYLTKIVLKSFAQLNGTTKWDPGTFGFATSDADLFINFGADSTVLFHSDIIINAGTGNLPKTYNLAAYNFKLQNKIYTIDLGDDDGSNSGWDKIRTLTANLGTATATNGKITITDTDCAVDVYFEER